MKFQKIKSIPGKFFARRLIRSYSEERFGSANTGERVGRARARFLFPLIFFIVSLVVSPLIFFGIVSGERFVSNLFLSRAKEDKIPQAAARLPEKQCLYRHPLDNTCLESPWENKKIIVVSVDNMVDGRPQSGIIDARLVIETPVEAGITRFLAFFAEGDDVSAVGPVRSARPYFIDFAREYGAALVHIGGSPEALERITKEDFPSIDEMKNGNLFWRDGGRVAPHSTFVSTENIFRAVEKKSDIAPLPFLEEDASGTINKESFLRIAAASSAYEVQWKYNREKNSYERLQSGAAHLDSSGRNVFAKNVVVARMPIEIIDEVGRRSIRTSGSGQALFFRNGERISGIWKTTGANRRMSFFDEQGNAVRFLPGTMWIEIVSKTAKVEYN